MEELDKGEGGVVADRIGVAINLITIEFSYIFSDFLRFSRTRIGHAAVFSFPG